MRGTFGFTDCMVTPPYRPKPIGRLTLHPIQIILIFSDEAFRACMERRLQGRLWSNGSICIRTDPMILIYAMVAGCVLLAALALRLTWRRSARRAEQALLASTEQGNLDNMQLLLRRHTNVNAKNAQGWTPLHIAIAGGDITLVDLLLRHGADVNAESYVGATPLDHAMTYGQRREVVQLLRQHGAQGHTDWDTIF